MKKPSGPDHTSTLDTVCNLGNLYSDQGKLKQAEEMYHRVLRGREKAFGPDHSFTLSIFHNLGDLSLRQDRLEEAEELYQRVLYCEATRKPSNTATYPRSIRSITWGLHICTRGGLWKARRCYSER